jgi:hypothetical protein
MKVNECKTVQGAKGPGHEVVVYIRSGGNAPCIPYLDEVIWR